MLQVALLLQTFINVVLFGCAIYVVTAHSLRTFKPPSSTNSVHRKSY